MKRPNDPTFSAARFRRGDPEAVETVRSRVHRILKFQVPPIPRVERDDLEQEIMMQLWQRLRRPSFDASREIWGFVGVVTTRRVIDWRRRRRPTVALENQDEESSASGAGARQHEARLLARQLVARLSATCRQILRLRFDQGLSYREMASRISRGEGALRVQLHRCIAQAREHYLSARVSDQEAVKP